ncbi:N-acetylmuramoyl-L-alanine amidase [Streptomyces yaizuensis]|uniref:N-acetylmuramoyl-L-alanine amidase n=1 Tax=Streptomyces yaizuensis TaxID=2989713 RepID=A0ABQ5NSF7_9ACTN|nr:N-acetylmuramoyl-L-alanine amidase [Streptomyces sp. YSPA8]GLF93302.1 N-acetylmuramoyl-L-alanine amidase [Streptomyces sp. YSPA8]
MERRDVLRAAAAVSAGAALPPLAGAPSAAAYPRPERADDPGALWVPASASNRTASNRPSAYRITHVVVHVTQETFDDTLAIFRDPARRVSAHYVVRSADGVVAQCVRERDIAWHAGNWGWNTHSVGIEHEGWVDRPAYFTPALYERSAALTAAVCDRYGIPKDRTHIIGHHEVPGATHGDPGAFWDWTRYVRLVNVA